MKKALVTSLLLGAVLVPTLQGCLPMLAVGAGGAAMATVDRRSLSTQTDDETIEWKASARVSEKFSEHTHVNFASFNRKVLIVGEVPSAEAKVEIERIVSSVPQVQGVYNELAIGAVSSFSMRSNDSYLTTLVKSRLVDSGKVNAMHVKVVTEAGVVYLLGLLTQREAQAAIQVARTTSGVRKVVNLLEVIPEAQAREADQAEQDSSRQARPPVSSG
jgi:osmotically-inducible protein OsmY